MKLDQPVKIEYINDADTEVVSRTDSTESVEQIGKSIVVGRKEAYHEDGRNVISVIINAISVRINMPLGTVKALIAFIIVVILAVLVFAFSNKNSDTSSTTSEAETGREYDYNKESRAANSERVANIGDYVIISSHYRYTLPDDVVEVWEPTDYYAENETFCIFNSSGNEYSIRSYLLDHKDAGLAETVKADLSQFDNMEFLDEQYLEGKYGDVLRIKFEATDEDGLFTSGIGYYWNDSDNKICCMEISSDEWHDDGVEEQVFDSVYKVSEDGIEVPAGAEETLQDQQKEEAMDSLAEDAIQDANESESPSDPLFD